MHIEHVALWTGDLERSREFYCTYFEAVAAPLYVSAKRPFRSYFLSFASGARLEIMQDGRTPEGGAHFAFAAPDVDGLTARLTEAGFKTTAPRWTGDGCYESTVEDPDGNLVEITAL